MDDHREVYEALARFQQESIPVALATVIETEGSMPRHAGSKMVVQEDGGIIGTVGGGAMESKVIAAALEVLSEGKARTATFTLNSIADGDPGICGGTARIFIEPIGAPSTLLVIGGGHVGAALAQLGKWAGYRVVISDDREAYANPAYLPGMDAYLVCAPGEVVDRMPLNRRTFVAAVTRGLPVDIDLIPALLETDVPYVGLIGSRRRWAITAKALREDRGMTDEQLARVRAPIGLELEAETPKEIAVSILAEIIMVQRGGTGKPMQWLGTVKAAEGVAG
ncbi:MAG: XdhC/CoxI family protein [Chloroflexota bacterium]